MRYDSALHDHSATGVCTMKTRTSAPLIACFSLFLIAGSAFADNGAISTMADITKSLNHYPSDSDKEKLTAITGSSGSSNSELAVATAILHIEHKVTDADKAKLSAIIADDSVPDELRQLAGILVTINHRPSDSDVATLATIVADSSQ